MKIEKKFAQMADGTKIYYEIQGRGYPLILLHGNMNDGRYFSRQTPFFDDYYRVFVIDSRGHGKSDNQASCLSFQLMAEDLATVMDLENIESADILGFSDGANLAMKFAAMYPKKVHRLVLNSGNTVTGGVKVIYQLATYFQYFFYWLLHLFNHRYQKKLQIVSLMLKDIDVSAKDLQQIKAPTLVIVGKEDLIKPSHSRFIARSIPHAQLVAIPRQGHLLARKDPVRFNREVLLFLKEKQV